MPRSKSPTNPDSYMPYFGAKFESAVKGYPIHVKWSYLASLWHYWSHTHCTGIPNNDAYLKRISDCENDHWEEVKQALFSENGLFSLEEDGKWHQQFCSELYAEATFRYKSVIEKSKKGNAVRWGIPEGVLEGVPKSSHIKLKINVPDNKQTKVGLPTLEEVKAYASMQNIQEADAEKFWHHFESTGWIDKNGHAVVRWQSKLIGWRTQAQTVELSGNSNGHGTGSVKLIVYSKELDRVNEAIRKIVDGASRDAFGTAMYDPLQKDKLMKLKSRRKELQGILGVTI